jgi:hypothetical protein
MKYFKIGEVAVFSRDAHPWNGNRVKVTDIEFDSFGIVAYEIENISYPFLLTMRCQPWDVEPETVLPTKKTPDHAGHEIVENIAGGKAFKYCRNCKVEVP